MRYLVLVPILCFVSVMSSCSRKPTIWITNQAFLDLPANLNTADKSYGTLRSSAELDAVLAEYSVTTRPDFLSKIDFTRKVVIVCPNAEITRLRIYGGIALICVRPSSTSGIGVAVATGKDTGLLGKFVEDAK